VKDALATHQRLVGGGFSETQAKACLRLIIDAESGRFDRQAVHELMASANLDPPQTGRPDRRAPPEARAAGLGRTP
jgi:hypothetical protein